MRHLLLPQSGGLGLSRKREALEGDLGIDLGQGLALVVLGMVPFPQSGDVRGNEIAVVRNAVIRNVTELAREPLPRGKAFDSQGGGALIRVLPSQVLDGTTHACLLGNGKVIEKGKGGRDDVSEGGRKAAGRLWRRRRRRAGKGGREGRRADKHIVPPKHELAPPSTSTQPPSGRSGQGLLPSTLGDACPWAPHTGHR